MVVEEEAHGQDGEGDVAGEEDFVCICSEFVGGELGKEVEEEEGDGAQ